MPNLLRSTAAALAMLALPASLAYAAKTPTITVEDFPAIMRAIKYSEPIPLDLDTAVARLSAKCGLITYFDSIETAKGWRCDNDGIDGDTVGIVAFGFNPETGKRRIEAEIKIISNGIQPDEVKAHVKEMCAEDGGTFKEIEPGQSECSNGVRRSVYAYRRLDDKGRNVFLFKLEGPWQ